jgi:hypothetical protein
MHADDVHEHSTRQANAENAAIDPLMPHNFSPTKTARLVAFSPASDWLMDFDEFLVIKPVPLADECAMQIGNNASETSRRRFSGTHEDIPDGLSLPKMPYEWSIPVINNIQMRQVAEVYSPNQACNIVTRGPKGQDAVFGRHNREGTLGGCSP